MVKCLVTGAAGFIGSTLSERLIKAGHAVVGVDCFTDYYPRIRKEKNLGELLKEPRFEFLEKDLIQADLPEMLDEVEIVYHLAAQAGVRASWGKDFSIYTRNNILGTQVLLEAAKDLRPRVVYASSSSIYGDTEDLPMRETSLPRPVSPYGVSKLACEHLCHLYTKNFGLETVSLRFFTVYGPRQRPDMAIHKFLRAALSGERIEIFGDGTQTRDFTFVDDIVSGLIAAGEKGRPGGVYNLGGGSRVQLKEVLQIIRDLTGQSLQLDHSPRMKGDAGHTCADTGAAKKDLEFAPRTELRDGIAAELEWIRSNL